MFESGLSVNNVQIFIFYLSHYPKPVTENIDTRPKLNLKKVRMFVIVTC